MYIPEAVHLHSAQPSLTQPTRGGRAGGDLGNETPIHSKDWPLKEAVTGLKLVFLKQSGDFLQSCGLAGLPRLLGA